MDVASTAMGLFGLFPTADNRGHFLSAAFSRKALLARSRPLPPKLQIRNPRRAGGKVLVMRPAGGRYDVQIRRNGRWVSLYRKTKKSTVRLPASANGKRIRARSRSAAGIPSRWRSRVVRAERHRRVAAQAATYTLPMESTDAKPSLNGHSPERRGAACTPARARDRDRAWPWHRGSRRAAGAAADLRGRDRRDDDPGPAEARPGPLLRARQARRAEGGGQASRREPHRRR